LPYLPRLVDAWLADVLAVFPAAFSGTCPSLVRSGTRQRCDDCCAR
jgi:hypothetical protein